MGKKGKKIKWKNLPSEFRTCIIAMLAFLIAGIGLILYGLIWSTVSQNDIHTVQAEIISIDKVSRNLDPDTIDSMREDGYTEEYIRYELEIGYRYRVSDQEYRYTARKLLDEAEDLSVGDTEALKYAIVKGKPVVNPDTDFTYIFVGIILVIIGCAAAIAAFLLRPKR